jgi:hypothetical protein
MRRWLAIFQGVLQCCGSGMFIPDPTFFHPGSGSAKLVSYLGLDLPRNASVYLSWSAATACAIISLMKLECSLLTIYEKTVFLHKNLGNNLKKVNDKCKYRYLMTTVYNQAEGTYFYKNIINFTPILKNVF